MDWRYTDWWGTLLGGIVGALVSGIVAAGTAWLVVNLTSRRQRRDTLTSEARQALVHLYMLAEEICDLLKKEPIPDTNDLEKRLRVDLVGVRALIVARGFSEDDVQLRIQTYKFLAGATARKEGGYPASVIEPYSEFRKYALQLIADIGRD
jgi:hypothetical protein